MKILKFPFLYLSVIFALGILSKPFFDKTIYYWSLALLIVFIVQFVIHLRTLFSEYYRCLYILLISISFWILGILTTIIHSHNFQDRHYTNIISRGGEKSFFEISIRDRLKPNSFSNKYLGNILKVNGEKAFGDIILIAPTRDSLPDIIIGQSILIFDSISSINSVLNPYQFDYKMYLSNKGIEGQLYLNKNNFFARAEVSNSHLSISNFRDKLINSFDIHKFSPEVSAIIKALLFGQRQELSDEINNDYRQVGVVHVLAISGLHLGIIYWFVLVILKQLGVRPKYQFLIAIFFLWFFALLSGFSASVVRAACMFTVMAVSYILGKSASTYNTLAVSFFIMLCFNPYYIYDVGFQLSFLAVLSIVFFMPIFTNFTNSKYIVWEYIKKVIAVSIAAQLGVLPLIIYYFHQIPVLFILGNIVVITLVIIILSSLIILLFLNFISLPIALLVGKCVSFAIELMNAYVKFLSRFSHYNIQDISLNGVLTLLLSISLFLIGFSIKKRKAQFAIVALLSFILYQTAYFYYVISEKESKEVLMLYNKQYTNLLVKGTDHISIYSNNSDILETTVIKDYCRAKFISKKRVFPLNSTLEISGKKLLIVDSLGNYRTNSKADVLLFTKYPKINFDRVLEYHQPELVLTAASFPKWESQRLNDKCIKKNIPFHSIAQKGYYKFDY